MELALLASVFASLIIACALSGKDWSADQNKARERRMAEHRLNARLLKFNI